MQAYSNWIGSVTYSSGGSYILSRDENGMIWVWDANISEMIFEAIKTNEDDVRVIYFSPDASHFIFIYGITESAGIRDTSSGKLLFKSNVLSLINSIVLLPSSDSKHKIASDGLNQYLVRGCQLKRKNLQYTR